MTRLKGVFYSPSLLIETDAMESLSPPTVHYLCKRFSEKSEMIAAASFKFQTFSSILAYLDAEVHATQNQHKLMLLKCKCLAKLLDVLPALGVDGFVAPKSVP